MATYVLVHGAWSGAHGLRKIRKLLQQQGHDVFTPSLTGLGERIHLATPDVDLTTHVRDVVNAVLYEDLADIVLVGYSYGGFVVTAALAHIADRVRHLVYLDAFVPSDGQAVYDLNGRGSQQPIELGQSWVAPPMARSLDDPTDEQWANARRTPHPVGCFTERVHLAKALEEYSFSRMYIKATGEPRPDQGGAFWAAADHAIASPLWEYREIATNHMIPENRPVELRDILLELAAA
jgi:pimeloyl-ACP methyl ester carboxylesterase